MRAWSILLCFVSSFFFAITATALDVKSVDVANEKAVKKQQQSELLILRLNALQHFQADFKQSTFANNGERLQNMTGRLAFSKPQQFFWQTDEPNAQQLIGNGKSIWHYDLDLEQVVVQDYALQLEQAPMLFILDDAARLLQNFSLVNNVIDVEANEELFELSANEKNSGIQTVLLMFKQQVLQEIAFNDNLQQRTEITFKNIRLSPAAKERFTFTVPDDVDVLYE